MVLPLFLILASAAMPLPPDAANVEHLRCIASEVVQPAGNTIWHVNIRAEYSDGRPDWVLKNLTMRPGDDDQKAIRDCAKYVKQWKKAQRKNH